MKTQYARSRASAIGLEVFYPIVPDAVWLKRLVPLGARTIQLRLKNATNQQIRSDIQTSIEICRANNCQLIVNDYWREAIDLGADFIHLGQEDLLGADLAAIQAAGVKLGISTHDEAELEIARAAQPDYVALGPIYETKLKAMAWAPQGLKKITRWRQIIGDLPLVAIGGLTPERAQESLNAGAQSASVITDFLTHPDPEGRFRTWLSWAKKAL